MRTTTQKKESKYRVTLTFFMNGWTLSYFDDKREIESWINTMRKNHGRITKQEMKDIENE